MTDPQLYGRTAWDFATEAIKSKTMISLVIILGLLVPWIVHLQAEPGTEVSLFAGLIKYQKAKAVAPIVAEPVKLTPPNTKDYVLPQAKDFQADPTPILDGTINLGMPSNPKDGSFYISGANVDIASFAIRTQQGDALKPRVFGNKAVVLPTDTLIELEYKGNFFLIETLFQRGDEGTFVMTVKKLEAPTMKLKRLTEYAAGG